MKKLLLYSLLTFISTSIYSSYRTKINGEWYICLDNKNGHEDCIPFDINKFINIVLRAEENEKIANQLIRSICVAELEYQFLYLTDNAANKIERPKSTKEEQQKSDEEFIKSMPNLQYYNRSLGPKALSEYNRKGLEGSEYIKSLLSEEELQLLHKVQELKLLAQNQKK